MCLQITCFGKQFTTLVTFISFSVFMNCIALIWANRFLFRVIFRENTKVNIVVNLCIFMNVFVMSFKGHITCKRVVTNVANKFFHFFMNNFNMILKNI